MRVRLAVEKFNDDDGSPNFLVCNNVEASETKLVALCTQNEQRLVEKKLQWS